MTPTQTSPVATSSRRIRLASGFAVLAVLTLGLIVVGALVRAFDAGLACPDWPLCKGALVPSFDFKVAFEWGHRVFAAAISLGLVGLTAGVWRTPSLWREMRTHLAWIWAVLLTQILFGGLTVLLLLAPWTVSVHLVLGNIFCVALLWTALDLREPSTARPPEAALSGSVASLIALVSLCLFLQIVLGGWVSSHYAGLACPNFPTCDGQSFVPTWQGLTGIHLLHRFNGFLLLGGFLALAASARGSGRVGMWSSVGLILVATQVCVGIANVLLQLPVAVTGLHSALAAAIIAVTAILVRELLQTRKPVRSAASQKRILEAP